MNHYNDLDQTTYGIDCGGDADGGKVQSYQEATGDSVPNLIDCVTKCNTCSTACAGFIDMLEERKCYFMSQLDYTVVAISDSVDIRMKYFNKVKTYEACPLGTSSVTEAEWGVDGVCTDCVPGKYQSRSSIGEHCEVCESGKYSNDNQGVLSTCLDCPAGKFPNAGKTDCQECPIT